MQPYSPIHPTPSPPSLHPFNPPRRPCQATHPSITNQLTINPSLVYPDCRLTVSRLTVECVIGHFLTKNATDGERYSFLWRLSEPAMGECRREKDTCCYRWWRTATEYRTAEACRGQCVTDREIILYLLWLFDTHDPCSYTGLLQYRPIYISIVFRHIQKTWRI